MSDSTINEDLPPPSLSPVQEPQEQEQKQESTDHPLPVKRTGDENPQEVKVRRAPGRITDSIKKLLIGLGIVGLYAYLRKLTQSKTSSGE